MSSSKNETADLSAVFCRKLAELHAYKLGYNADMKIIEFTLEHEYVELNQLLKLVGLAGSGGMGKAIVASGIVTVNGEVELRKTCKIVAGNIVHLEDHEIHVVGT